MTLLTLAAQLLITGVMSLAPGIESRWPASGRWIFPVGDDRQIGCPGEDGLPGYAETRNIGGPSAHRGVDLSNRNANGMVRAAAHGVVVWAGDKHDGYGHYVVLAHREPGGELVYSIYAHLVRGSVAVRMGDVVLLGETLGRVGRTGHATGPHLHFEVRTPTEFSERWQGARVVDPIAFVSARLPSRSGDAGWAGPYLEWAEGAGLLQPEAEYQVPIRRGAWRRMLGSALAARSAELPWPTPQLRAALSGLFDRGSRLDSSEPVGWPEIAGDLTRALAAGLCLPRAPVSDDLLRKEWSARFGALPSSSIASLAGLSRPPSPAEVCLALATARGADDREELAGDLVGPFLTTDDAP